MASSSSVLSENQLQCSICLDVFTDPVTTPCGHNFCMICLQKFWDSRSHCQCPVCKSQFSRRPELSVNTFISGLAASFKKSDKVKSSSSAEHISLSFLETCLFSSVDVILDADTANPYLILSYDGKQVTCGDTKQNLPDNPERFTECLYVLGKDGFTSGRFYYEVQVGGKTEWFLGVTTESSNRKRWIPLCPEDGVWFFCLLKENKFYAWDCPPVRLSLNSTPQKVGVLVDYEEGLVSFYDVEARSHIYSYTGQAFTEKLFPIFNPSDNDEGRNSEPLIICPVHQL